MDLSNNGILRRGLRSRVQWIVLCALSVLLLTNAEAGGQYLLGAGDSVSINVYQQEDLNVSARVGPEGTIAYPLLGSVKIGGLTPEAAGQKIARLLEDGGFIKHPQVSLNVSAFVSQQVAVLGQINNPGNYPLEGESGILDILARAGGVTKEAADVITVVKKEGGKSVKHQIDLKRFYEGDMSEDIQITAGDVVLIPKMDTFYIYGEVKSPGIYRLERGMTTMQALSVGGGLTERGSLSGIKVNRRQADGEMKKISVELTDPLHPDDVVYVKERLF